MTTGWDIAVGDTSAFVAIEQGRPLRQSPPARLAVSYVTVAELTAGVLQAPSPQERARRLRTLVHVRRLDPLPVDAPVAAAWPDLRQALRERKRRMPVNDSWIAATALAYGLPVVAQDEDYAEVPGLEIIRL